MKQLPMYLLTLCLCFTLNTLWATHNRGGRIEYTHVTGYIYNVKIITYTKISPPSDQADRSQLTINWGDGSAPESLPRASNTLIAPDVQENIYTGGHNFSQPGHYTLSMQDPNRNDRVLNINNGNSIGIPFYVEAQLIIPNAAASNNSAQLLLPPILDTESGQPFEQTLTAYDPDGDILVYDLVAPNMAVGQPVTGYQFVDELQPGPNNMLDLSLLNGKLTWNSPPMTGEYQIAIRIREYRNCVLVGSTIVDQQILVSTPVSNTQWIGNSAWSVDSAGYYSYTIAPNTPISFNLAFVNSNTTVDLAAYSETISFGTASVTSFSNTPNKDSLIYQWTPPSTAVRCAPYIVTFRGQSDYPIKLYKEISVAIYVRDNTISCDAVLDPSCFTSIASLQAVNDFNTQLYPNPFQQSCTFHIETEKAVNQVQLSIFDALGRQVFSQQFQGNTYEYDNQQLPAGWYIYQLELENGDRSIGKMLKQ